MQSAHYNQLEVSLYQLEAMADLVEKAVTGVMSAFATLDAVEASIIMENDKSINSFEIDIDNSTYNVFAVSTENIPSGLLRKILSIQKINPILERIGDHATNIAEAIVRLGQERYSGDDYAIAEMGAACVELLHDAVHGFFAGDQLLAGEVLERDAGIDRMYAAITASIKETMFVPAAGLSFEAGFVLFGIAKDLERIADLSINIAEETLYVVDGAIVKHRQSVGTPLENGAG